jgi:2-keto-myo-inositol isomerase
MSSSFDRRSLLAVGAMGLATSVVQTSAKAEAEMTKSEAAFSFCLNASTIRKFDGKGGTPRPILEQVTIAAHAGYSAIEPWIPDVRAYQESGGSLPELRKTIEDSGLTVESSIGFASWIVDDDKRRAEGIESAKRDMELIKAIGGKRIAAPPVGATEQSDLNLFAAAERYRKLLEAGEGIGVVPQLELWGFSKSLSRLGELMFVAVESAHPAACVLPDIYHIYKGGSAFDGLSLIDGKAIHCFHFNDYPAEPPRAKIDDADRVYPGAGVAPIAAVVRSLVANGCRCVLSLELFNREYWKQDPLEVAKTGLNKMKAVVEAAHPSRGGR